MCTLVLHHAPGAAFPLLVAANRDEMTARGADAPAAHWPARPAVIGGRDRSAGGTWMAVNRAGVMAAILNRPGSLGPESGKRSRGELPLLALDHAGAADAAAAIAALDGRQWRGFN
ncbi:MAG: NRDE family protein, partial [Rhodospirillales bacterium]|nr:NRDE family protein [Rhodospirillales bacterium]